METSQNMNLNSVQWYISQFPESLYPCPSSYLPFYSANVIEGKEIASTSNVLICGIARNISTVLPYTIARIERLGSYFKKYHVYIFENDSSDDTPQILHRWHLDNPSNITIESLKLNFPTFTDPRGIVRRKFMSMARNKYLAFALGYVTYNLTHFVIIFDLDLLGGWSYHGIFNSLGQSHRWDIVGSNSMIYQEDGGSPRRLFYDSWAFRPLDHPEALSDSEVNLYTFRRGEPLVQVNSCFGGLAIYKTHFLSENINYDETDCDHPTLHNALIERGYKIFLNPSQITLYNKSQYVV